MKKIYVTDLDGTLLSNGGEISEYTREKLKQLVDEGVMITVASARNIHSIKELLGEVDFRLPVIEFNGAYITDYATKEKLVVNKMDDEIIMEVLAAIREEGNHILLTVHENGEDMLYFDNINLNRGTIDYLSYRKSLGKNMTQVDDVLAMDIRDAMTVNSIGHGDNIKRAYKRVMQMETNSHGSHYMKSVYDEWYWLNVSSINSNKGEALRILRERFLEKDDFIIAFGDNYNDMEMIKEADRGVVVSGASGELKEIADEIIGFNHEDSVIRYIEKEDRIGKV